jgi:hypothetical protein
VGCFSSYNDLDLNDLEGTINKMIPSKFTVILAVVLIFLFSACSQAVNQPGAVGTALPGDLPAAALEARRFLSDSLGVDFDQIRVVSAEPVEWPDACLGLPQADEACAEVITPGYNITLGVNGQTYEIHTDEQGVNIRQKP